MTWFVGTIGIGLKRTVNFRFESESLETAIEDLDGPADRLRDRIEEKMRKHRVDPDGGWFDYEALGVERAGLRYYKAVYEVRSEGDPYFVNPGCVLVRAHAREEARELVCDWAHAHDLHCDVRVDAYVQVPNLERLYDDEGEELFEGVKENVVETE